MAWIQTGISGLRGAASLASRASVTGSHGVERTVSSTSMKTSSPGRRTTRSSEGAVSKRDGSTVGREKTRRILHTKVCKRVSLSQNHCRNHDTGFQVVEGRCQGRDRCSLRVGGGGRRTDVHERHVILRVARNQSRPSISAHSFSIATTAVLPSRSPVRSRYTTGRPLRSSRIPSTCAAPTASRRPAMVATASRTRGERSTRARNADEKSQTVSPWRRRQLYSTVTSGEVETRVHLGRRDDTFGGVIFVDVLRGLGG